MTKKLEYQPEQSQFFITRVLCDQVYRVFSAEGSCEALPAGYVRLMENVDLYQQLILFIVEANRLPVLELLHLKCTNVMIILFIWKYRTQEL